MPTTHFNFLAYLYRFHKIYGFNLFLRIYKTLTK